MRSLFPLLDSLHRLHRNLTRPKARRAPGSRPAADRLPARRWMAYLADQLTPRERDIVGLILLGYPTAKIASRLKLSVNTIKNHKKRMYHKLDITTERELFLGFVNFLFGSSASARLTRWGPLAADVGDNRSLAIRTLHQGSKPMTPEDSPGRLLQGVQCAQSGCDAGAVRRSRAVRAAAAGAAPVRPQRDRRGAEAHLRR